MGAAGFRKQLAVIGLAASSPSLSIRTLRMPAASRSPTIGTTPVPSRNGSATATSSAPPATPSSPRFCLSRAGRHRRPDHDSDVETCRGVGAERTFGTGCSACCHLRSARLAIRTLNLLEMKASQASTPLPSPPSAVPPPSCGRSRRVPSHSRPAALGRLDRRETGDRSPQHRGRENRAGRRRTAAV